MDRPNSIWTFFSNHGHVLICLAMNSDARLRDIAERVGITERAVQSIVTDLEQGGVITRIREGRRNRYEIHGEVNLRHDIEAHCCVADLIEMAGKNGRRKRRRKAAH